MKARSSKLLLEQLDQRLAMKYTQPPRGGWICAIRKALRMSQRQLGKRLGITAQGVKALENNEANGAISLQRLSEIANALNLELSYTFRTRDGSLQKLLENTARKAATEIVRRTAISMSLENQGNSAQRLKKAVQQKTEEFCREIPKHLWE